ncbi:MAG: hypothetical protein QXT63_05740, partial [Thermoplasmata archaeon]
IFEALNKVNELITQLITKICESVTIPTLINPDEDHSIIKEVTPPVIFYNSRKNDVHASSFSNEIYDVDYINDSGTVIRFYPEPNLTMKNISFVANAIASELGDESNIFLGGSMRTNPKMKLLNTFFDGIPPSLQIPQMNIENISLSSFNKEN